jgi:predicted DNA-binding protein (MmcQ/YjbR family)
MPARTKDDPRLTRVSTLCLALPGASREDMGDHAAFAVRGKKFAYFLNNHHGDRIVSVCARAFPGENLKLIEAHPRKFYSPAYIGPRGWVGLRLDRGAVDWDEVRDLLTASYLQAAPKKLRDEVEATLE